MFKSVKFSYLLSEVLDAKDLKNKMFSGARAFALNF